FKGKVFVIGNPFPEVDTTEHVDHQIEKSQYIISHLGRLDNDCKQQTLAIEAFHRACSENSEWRLDLWGTGADRDMIQQKIDELALGDKVALKGFCTDPIAVLKNADIFLFPSRYEGFPLALGEADRKSTRLNSSHVKKSYAVFCLKKKNFLKIKNH